MMRSPDADDFRILRKDGVGATLVVALLLAGDRNLEKVQADALYQSGQGHAVRKQGDHKGRPYSGDVGADE